MTCPPLPFACNSVINTHMAFRFLNSLCGGGRVTCLRLHFRYEHTYGVRLPQFSLQRRSSDLSTIPILWHFGFEHTFRFRD